MTDNLKQLALAAKSWILCDDPDCTCREVHRDFHDALTPEAVLDLIADAARYQHLRRKAENGFLEYAVAMGSWDMLQHGAVLDKIIDDELEDPV